MPVALGSERPARRIRVLVADDDAFFRHLVATVLKGAHGIEVVGEAVDATEAVARARALRPDVVLLDVTMPGGGGAKAAGTLQRSVPDCHVVMLTGSGEERDVQQCLQAGATAYVLKPALTGLANVIRAVSDGVGVLLSASIARGLVERHETGSPPALSSREVEVLTLIAKGCTNDDIARQLWLSSHTVKRHVANILSKLDVGTRGEAVAQAIADGLLPREVAAG